MDFTNALILTVPFGPPFGPFGPRIVRLHIMILQALILVAMSSSLDAESCGALDVPPAIASEMRNLYKGWRVVALSDLGEYERKVWSEKTAQCPGAAAGHFVPFTNRSYAFVLIKHEGSAVFQTGVVFWVGSDKRVHSQVFVPAAKAPNICVVWKLTEKDIGGQDEIVYEAIEVGSSAFAWKHGAFVKRPLSY